MLLADVLMALILFSIAAVIIYQLFATAFILGAHSGDQAASQQDVRLSLDRIARLIRETGMGFGRFKIYAASQGCSGGKQDCLALATARTNCLGTFGLVGGRPEWKAMAYLWLAKAAGESTGQVNLGCQPGVTSTPVSWPAGLTISKVLASKIVDLTYTLSGAPTPNAVQITIQEQAREAGNDPYPLARMLHTQTVFFPQNR